MLGRVSTPLAMSIPLSSCEQTRVYFLKPLLLPDVTILTFVLFPSSSSIASQPDRPFHNFRASKSVDRRFVTTYSMSISGFWGPQNCEKVGREAPRKITPPFSCPSVCLCVCLSSCPNVSGHVGVCTSMVWDPIANKYIDCVMFVLACVYSLADVFPRWLFGLSLAGP